ncbi:retinoid-inducible serine carboxypeptidase-like isoform X2 [Neocloeon triangulifer]|uniref:retinoid-inducible serine carboxypeptidase-like isoform X2 n=1 Tax=Neocloeon triangulifer TaxID=2078957 RepID=UPI00286EE9ED|nr:retinoid-inducible serine carboxypeptidase-like isoform X2 [Neocloeon triangulifer]
MRLFATTVSILFLLVNDSATSVLSEPAPTNKSNIPDPGGEDWGYLDVRPGAHMFYWLYTSTAASDPTTLPIVIWLQGGPGAGGSGHGNFKGMGPLDLELKPRNTSWVHHVNILYLDNPVGAGYSYVDDLKDLANNATGIALDLVSFMKLFYEKYPDFKETPVYCFSQSYGGKMAAHFGLEMANAMKAGEIESNFKGVALGSAWISPIDSTTSWAPYLLQAGLVDTSRFKMIDKYAAKCRTLVEKGEWKRATRCWSNTEVLITILTHKVDFYNIMYKTSPTLGKSDLQTDDEDEEDNEVQTRAFDFNFRSDDENGLSINDLMNGPVFDKLSATLHHLNHWSDQSADVFKANWVDFMKPAVDIVEKLLEETNLTVAVDNGQLDLICNTPAQLIWAENMKWSNVSDWIRAPRNAFTVNGFTEGFVKRYGRFSFWWVNRAGHSIPYDNPLGSIVMMRDIVGLPREENAGITEEYLAESKKILDKIF